MNKMLTTNSNNWTALVARIALGITIFPHGAQKLLGLFGGYGYTGTMGFLTTQAGLPYILALLVILIEFFGSAKQKTMPDGQYINRKICQFIFKFLDPYAIFFGG